MASLDVKTNSFFCCVQIEALFHNVVLLFSVLDLGNKASVLYSLKPMNDL